jgi:hypothetical protein
VAAVAAELADWHSIAGVVGASLPYGGGLSAIRLTLAPGSEPEADRLLAKYGDLGQLQVLNTGTADLAFYGSGSGRSGNLFDPVTGEQVGEFRGAFTADLHPWLFPVGASVRIPVRVGATACGGSALSLKPGKYIARAELWLGPRVATSGSVNDFKATVSVSAETPIAIIA